MIYMSLFLVVSSNISMCADSRIRKNTDTNEILREGVTAKNSNDNKNSGIQRLGKRHLGDDKFKAFESGPDLAMWGPWALVMIRDSGGP